ncbi:MAG: CYTH domain-containing protein [Bacteroides sp.]|nr:CYTH domain-containing protein [Bacteroides sp.]
MAFEIEHKYLVKDTSYRDMAAEIILILQGYIDRTPERTVRIRIIDDKGFITVKGKTIGDTRLEFEYEIPLEDARQMMNLCLPGIIEKRRYVVPFEGFVWEVDEFAGTRKGLVLAEIELPDSSTPYTLPSFIGENVTGRPEFYNSNL